MILAKIFVYTFLQSKVTSISLSLCTFVYVNNKKKEIRSGLHRFITSPLQVQQFYWWSYEATYITNNVQSVDITAVSNFCKTESGWECLNFQLSVKAS